MNNTTTNSCHIQSEKHWLRSGVTSLTLITTIVITVALWTRRDIVDKSCFFLRTTLGYTITPSPTQSLILQNSTILEQQLATIVHYATSKIIPQQTREEIAISYHVLRDKIPCNFLVFGLGYDSQMWAALNPGGTTLFLEEDSDWVEGVLKDAPHLNAHAIKYRTRLSEADLLFDEYKIIDQCGASKSFLRDNQLCRLSLHNLPQEVYDKEWDLIMIDAPRGYFPEAPGRMVAIYSAAVMARQRRSNGPTHIFLHDVDRQVEKKYAEEFLCRYNLAGAAGRLWHFVVPPSPANTTTHTFC